MLSDSSIDRFKATLRGSLVLPSDPDYDEARRVYNAMIDKHPRLIARCADVADVIAAVNFARENNLTLAVRGGGHNVAGLGTCNDGLVIDLSHLKGIRVDPAARTARVEGGCTWGDVDHATHAFGLATPCGFISTTGVAGLTLGGGIGYLTRSCGLTIDNLLAADLVLADGSFVTASADENSDLFWAIRGGGGNFGIVTSFLFKLHQVDTVIGGPMLWEMEHAAELLRWFREFIPKAPEVINGFFAFLTVPPGAPFPEHLHNKKMCGIVWCYTGPADLADDAFGPIRAFREPAVDFVAPVPFPAFQSAFDPLYPPGLFMYWKADFFNEIDDEAVALNVEHGARLPTPLSTMHIYPINGAAHKFGRDVTPFSFRDSSWAQVIVGVDPDAANKEVITQWARNYWEALHPHSAGGAYINFMMDEGEDRVKATYRDNYQRLAEVKTKYDPQNLFRVNQNITPAAH
jgi:FAD/FMN-containing dehydrogenase